MSWIAKVGDVYKVRRSHMAITIGSDIVGIEEEELLVVVSAEGYQAIALRLETGQSVYIQTFDLPFPNAETTYERVVL